MRIKLIPQHFILQVFMVLMVWNLFVPIDTKYSSREGKSRRRKLESHPRRSASSVRISPDPMMTGPESGVMPGAVETDFDKSIEDMVSQVRNNPNLSINKCVVDRKLWMSNSRSLSPWSYRWVKWRSLLLLILFIIIIIIVVFNPYVLIEG